MASLPRSPALVLLLPLLAGCGAQGSGGPAIAASTGRVYVLGSSFSRDAVPEALDGKPAWEIYCGQTLEYIFDNPTGSCGLGSTPWTQVLEPPAVVYDAISFQPLPAAGVSLDQDASDIQYWLRGQPLNTVAVIQATWPRPAVWEDEIHHPNPDPGMSSNAIEYYYALVDELKRRDPWRSYRLTRSNEMLDYIFHDPASPILFSDLFRDASGHMSFGVGWYLQHNALRQAMGQETGVDATADGVDPSLRDYLDGVVELYPTE